MTKAAVLIGYKTINYGAAVQAVATQRMFEKYGLQVEIINLDKLWSGIKKKKARFYITNLQFGYLIESKGKMLISRLIRKINKSYGREYRDRCESFDSFLNKNLKFTVAVESYDELSRLAEEFDFVILGSDQVWLPSSVITDVYTLSFAWNKRSVRTMSYAPSFGVDYILPRYRNSYKKMLENIDYLSVREAAGVKLTQTLINSAPHMVADPVLMLSRDEWSDIVPDEKVKENNYVFVYLIGNNKQHRAKTIEYAGKKNLSTVGLIHLDEYIKEDEKIYDSHYVSLSPESFVNYIRHATVVFTDSYHCFLLSLINKRSVGVFLRHQTGSKVSTNNRLYSIMDRLGIGNGILDPDREIADKDLINEFGDIDSAIEEYRKQSEMFIKKAVNEGE